MDVVLGSFVKRFALLVLSMTGLLAACGNSSPPNDTSITQNTTTITPDERLTQQAIYPNATCWARYPYRDVYSCGIPARDEVEAAGLVYRKAKPSFVAGSNDAKTTVGATYLNGTMYITVWGGSTANAKTQIERQVRLAGYQWVTPSGTIHAEQRLYNLYQGYIVSIGISNFNGPCASCKTNVADVGGIPISWYPNTYW